jgi:hypothetical protein
MAFVLFNVVSLSSTANASVAPTAACSRHGGFASGDRSRGGGFWVWTTRKIITDSEEFDSFTKNVVLAGARSVYLYLVPDDYTALGHPGARRNLQNLLGILNGFGVRAYGMDGWRGYFSDAEGPATLYKGVRELIAYNRRVGPRERFAGFMLDLEPQDGQGVGKPLFHNGLAESKLTRKGRQERDLLMLDWLEIHDALRTKLTAAGLRFASSLPAWTDNYFGEPVLATYGGTTADVTQFLMRKVDDYAVMSYRTDAAAIIAQLVSKLTLAEALPCPPRVFAGVETHAGAGYRVSFSDTPPLNRKKGVLNVIEAVCGGLSNYNSFAGVNIHDWAGWRDLPSEHVPGFPHPKHAATTSGCGWRSP